jgi:hypothetical protein
MSHHPRTAARVASLSLLALLVAGSPTSAKPAAQELLTGLSSPKALALSLEGNPVVGQGTFGPPGPILEYLLHGPARGTTQELLDEAAVVDIAMTPDGAGWAIGGDGMLYRMAGDGVIEPILDIAAYQASDPDPVDQDDFPEESNPYGLTALPSNDVLFSDAAANDVVRVTPEGDATTVARFDLEDVATDHLPEDFGEFPPTITAEAVPTSVTIGPDGWAYVGELKGFPFRPGTSHVWRVDPYGEDAWCSVREPDPSCTVYRSGLTAIHDIAFNPNNGRLYVYELAADGVLAYEAGFESGEFPPAVLLKVKKHSWRELVPGALSQPGGVVVARDGTVFVTDGMFTDGRLLRIRG